ncbi:AAA family ATPase [bacterium]|nr:AAA family ATPase [bacterium]
MQKVSTFILSDESSTTELLKLFVSELDELQYVETPGDYSQILDCISKEKSSLFIVDLSLNKAPKIDLINKISHYKNCKILALSDNPSVSLIVEIMRSGAKEFVPIPVIKNEFFDAIQKLLSSFEENINKNKCKIISVFSNKGGLGKTSIATNLALELAKKTKENVALIDLNFQMGDMTTFLNLQPSFNISYMLENLDKINETFLLSTLERYKRSNLYVLADPPFFKQADNIQPQQITRLFNTLKETFAYIIVDTEASFDGKNIATFDNSDMILLVTVANLPVLRNTQRCLELFGKLGYDRNKTKIILNRYIENDEIKSEDVQQVLNRNIYKKIPNNYFTMMAAINKGVPITIFDEQCDISTSYKELAQKICDNFYKQTMAQKFEYILNKE